MNRELPENPFATLVSGEHLPWAAELIPDVFIQLNLGIANRKSIVAALVEMRFSPRGANEITDSARERFRSKAHAAIQHLLSAGLIRPEFKKGPVYLTEEGYDFIRKLNAEVIQELSQHIEPGFKVSEKKKPTPPWKPDAETWHALSKRIEAAKSGLPREHPLEARAAAMAARIAANLPEMPLDKMYVLWTNASNNKSHPNQVMRLAAPMLLEAIEKERNRRGPEAFSSLPGGEFFRWPSTLAEQGNGYLDFEADVFGVLAQTGYRVGKTRGEPEAVRRRTLARLFQDEITYVSSAGEWGSRGGARRLKKLAYTIAALTRNAKRRGSQMAQAVAEWEADLEYLHDCFYVGKFDFPWPNTTSGSRSGRN